MSNDNGINETTEQFSATDMSTAASSGYADGVMAGFVAAWDSMARDIHATAILQTTRCRTSRGSRPNWRTL